jgi:pyruvate/2-oxoglutarate dehydrogenase complex dihydrolipoamide acyltransferase (E2) component
MNDMKPAFSLPIDRDTIQRLVAEVILRIQAEGRPLPPASSPAPSVSVGGAPEPKAPAATFADRVITLHALERLPAGTRQMVVDATAVITPSARDYARDAGIVIVRGGRGGPGAVAPPRPFLVAHAQCASDPAAKAAAIVRAVPGGQQLPPSGLADVIAAIATHASRDAARGILLTSRPALGVIMANRSASLRAVTGRDAASITAVAADCQANLIVVDPATFSGILERLCVDFTNRAAGAIPVELAAPATGCGCKAH